jgi:beta-lactamase regulating signal transducer with metallopeptidase domain
MNPTDVLSGAGWERLALSLLHFLWQGAVVAGVLVLALRLFRLRRGSQRYAAYLAALGLMAACPLMTHAVLVARRPTPPPAVGLVPTPTVTGMDRRDVGPPERDPGRARSVRVAPVAVGTDDGMEDGSGRPVSTARLGPAPVGPAAAPREDAAGTRSLRTLLGWVTLAWLGGVAVLSFRLLLSCVGVLRWKHGAAPLPEAFQALVRRLARRMGHVSRLRVLVSQRVPEALTAGLLRPVVLVPAAMLAGTSPGVLEAVLAHELAHIHRLDLWVNLLQRVVETLLFYHPAVWWVSGRLRAERELCCDTLAAGVVGDRAAYAEALERAARGAPGLLEGTLAVGLTRGKGTLLERVHNILGLESRQTPAPAYVTGVLGVGVVLAAACGMWLSLSAATEAGEVTRRTRRAGPGYDGVADTPHVPAESPMHVSADTPDVPAESPMHVSAGRWSPTATRLRRLRFPEHFDLGSLALRRPAQAGVAPADDDWRYEPTGYTRWKPARRQVLVPAGRQVALHAGNGGRFLDRLARLRPDDLYHLSTQMGVYDRDMQHVAHLTGLRELDMRGAVLTVQGLAALWKLTHLEFLALGRDCATGTAARYVAGLEPLRHLDMGVRCSARDPIGADDVRELAALPRLETLCLGLGELSDEAIEALSLMPGLKRLSLGAAAVTARDLGRLAGVSALERLRLSGVNDEHLRQLSGLRGLRWLEVEGTGITDAGLAHLAHLRALERISVEAPNATEAGGALLAGERRHVHTGRRGDEAEPAGALPRTEAGAGAAGGDAAGDRVLQFPDGPKEAVVLLYAEDDDVWSPAARAVAPGTGVPAAGAVSVPAGERVVLSCASGAEPAVLSLLGPDDVYQLSLAYVDDTWVVEVARLTGLNHLVVQEVRAAPGGLSRLASLASLESVSLAGPLTRSDLDWLGRLPAVRCLAIRSDHLAGGDLEQLAGLSHLEELTLDCDRLTDDDLRCLAGMRSLERLCLAGRPRDVKGAGLAHLAPVAGLRRLALLGAPLRTEAGWRGLGALDQVEELMLRGDVFRHGDEGYAGVAMGSMASLKRVHVATGSGRLGLVSALGLAEAAQLEELELGGTDVDAEAAAVIARMPSLRSIAAGRFDPTPAAVAEALARGGLQEIRARGPVAEFGNLGRIRSLRVLELRDVRVTREELTALNALTGLRLLCVGVAPGPGALDLSGLRKLESLELRMGEGAHDEDLAALSELTALRELRLTRWWHESEVTDAGMAHLAGLTALERLEIGGPQLTGAALVHLAGMRNLEYLSLYVGELSDEDTRHLDRLGSLKELRLDTTRAGWEALNPVVDRLRERRPDLKVQ